jgi:hypothetical protein
VYVAVGLSIAAAVSGGTMSSSMGRVIAARNVGQCWGPAGSSVFSLPIDVCGGTDGVDDVQLEAQGDATVSVALALIGVLGLVVSCALHRQMKRSSWRSSMEELSVLSALTPLWVAALPILVGGAVTAAAAPMSEEHPRASFCAGAAALVAVSLITAALLLFFVALIPLAVPNIFDVVVTSRNPSLVAESASFLRRLVVWFRLIRQRLWRWEPKDDATSTAHRMVRTLLFEYRALWYAALDSIDVCVLAVLGAVGPLLAWSGCVGAGVAVVAVLAVQLLVCIVCRPMTRPLDWYVGGATLALTTGSSLLRVVYGASTTDDEREDRGVLLIAAAVLDIAVSIITLGPTLLDASELVQHCKLHFATKSGNVTKTQEFVDITFTGNETFADNDTFEPDLQTAMTLLLAEDTADGIEMDSLPINCFYANDDPLDGDDVFVNALQEKWDRASDQIDDTELVAEMTVEMLLGLSAVEVQSEGLPMVPPTDLLSAYESLVTRES